MVVAVVVSAAAYRTAQKPLPTSRVQTIYNEVPRHRQIYRDTMVVGLYSVVKCENNNM